MMKIKLVKAVATNKDFLLELRKLTMSEYLKGMGVFLSDEEHQNRVNEQFNCCYMIVSSNIAIGMIKLQEDVDKIKIMQVQILPEYQGQGIGKQLIQQIKLDATNKRLYLSLSVLKNNPAKNLYEKLGFNVIDEDKYEYYLECHST